MQADPEVIDFIVNAARSFIPQSRVILFGSRVKNASQERSDYDIAIEAGTGEISHFDAAYGRFAGLVREKSPTLCSIDLVRLDRCDADLRARVLREGVNIYDGLR